VVSDKLALVTGVGPGTGASIARRFAAGGYRVAMLARDAQRLREMETEIPGLKAFPVDVTDTDGFGRTLDQIEAELGVPDVVIHNAVGGAFGTFLEIDPADLKRNFQTNVMALLHLARRTAPAMLKRGTGAIIVTGNTSALRGKPKFAGFAPTKAAQRILAESIARELGPQGVHVAYVVIDAVIESERSRRRQPEKPDEFFIRPDDIAEEVWHVAHQARSSWSFNVEVRPFGEAW
jgi:NADP-dependent 3-hydroxy acid dehydrogenase YdfG